MYTKLPCETIEFCTVLIQGTGIALLSEQLRLLANGTQEWGLTCSDQAPTADIFLSNRHKWTWFDIALRAYMERQPSCPRAPILYTILIVGELTEDDLFAASEFKNSLMEGITCDFVQDPIRLRVRSTRYVFSEEANYTANADHLVNELIRSELSGIGSGVCGDETKNGMSFAKTRKSTYSYLVGGRLTTLVSVAGEPLNANE
jgi:hypothetical protein